MKRFINFRWGRDSHSDEIERRDRMIVKLLRKLDRRDARIKELEHMLIIAGYEDLKASH